MRGKTAPDLTEAEVREIAVRYLTRREYGVEELRQKLLQRGADFAITDAVVGELAEENLVSDKRFTDMYVRMRIRRLFGPLKIRGELRQRGIPDHLVAAALQVDDEIWVESAVQWAGRRIHADLDFAQKAKIHRKLTNRGFNHEQANSALARLISSQ